MGTAGCEHIDVDGEQRFNPLWVVEKLKKTDAEMTMGAVHGDLHPGNIVLSASNHPRVIDFGWSRSNGHIAQDFVLLECNFRFLMLRPQLSLSEVKRFSEWFEWDATVPSDLSDYSRARAEIILQLRAHAKEAFPSAIDWNWEYVVPLFLVAFGLLRFAPQLGNQAAALFTVLGLANHIDGILSNGE